MEQSFQEFRQIAGIKKGTKHKISGSFGVYDVYKKIRKNNWYNIGRPVTEHEFYTIIRSVNNKLAEEVGKGKEIKFPYSMGALELRKSQRGVSIKDGKLKITYPVNWNETLKLWYEDEEARKNKTVLRHEVPYVFSIRYNKFNAEYENKCFYAFTLNNKIKDALKENIKQGKIDTIW